MGRRFHGVGRVENKDKRRARRELRQLKETSYKNKNKRDNDFEEERNR